MTLLWNQNLLKLQQTSTAKTLTNSEMQSTSSSERVKEQGRAIARGIAEEQARKERNQASAEKRKDSTLRNAAQKVFNRSYSD